MRRLVAGVCEHALVVRRAHALRAAHHEGYRAAVLRSCVFLEGVVPLSGQSRRHGLCANHRAAAADHLESCGDVLHEHRKCAQHRIDPAIERRRGYQPSVRVFVPCHGAHYTPALAPVGSGTRYPTIFRARSLKLLAKVFRCPTNSVQAYPPPAVILGLVPRISVGCCGGIR